MPSPALGSLQTWTKGHFPLTSRWMFFSQERLLKPGKYCPLWLQSSSEGRDTVSEVSLPSHHLLPGISHKSLGDRKERTKKGMIR